MRYFKNNQTQKLYAIPEGQEFLIHSDWVELTLAEYDALMHQSHLNEGLFDIDFSPDKLREIQRRLIEIDDESIRPLRAIATNTDELLDHNKLKSLNDERQRLLFIIRQAEKL